MNTTIGSARQQAIIGLTISMLACAVQPLRRRETPASTAAHVVQAPLQTVISALAFDSLCLRHECVAWVVDTLIREAPDPANRVLGPNRPVAYSVSAVTIREAYRGSALLILGGNVPDLHVADSAKLIVSEVLSRRSAGTRFYIVELLLPRTRYRLFAFAEVTKADGQWSLASLKYFES